MTRREVVMDTNVAIQANKTGTTEDRDCVDKSIKRLRRIQDEAKLLLDDCGLIIGEYRRYLSPSGQPGPGDAFFKWVHDNHYNQEYCERVPVTPDLEWSFREFPHDSCLESFDRNDRKFVAVALASGTSPQIINATDSDWWNHREALERNGVRVVCLCPDLIRKRRS